MIICPVCNEFNSDNHKFCFHCGNSLEKSKIPAFNRNEYFSGKFMGINDFRNVKDFSKDDKELLDRFLEIVNHKPKIIVDFIFKDGLFFISVSNFSYEPLYRVSITFDKNFCGVEGTKKISELPLFQNIEFLAPQKEIRTFLDTSYSYFKREEPTKIKSTISYYDYTGNKYNELIKHDLSIYKEIGYVKKVK